MDQRPGPGVERALHVAGRIVARALKDGVLPPTLGRGRGLDDDAQRVFKFSAHTDGSSNCRSIVKCGIRVPRALVPRFFLAKGPPLKI